MLFDLVFMPALLLIYYRRKEKQWAPSADTFRQDIAMGSKTG